MKLVVYLTKTKVWYAGKSVDWTGNDLVKIFKDIRRDERVNDVRIVLGNDVSFVGAYKLVEGMTREKHEEATKGLMPFPLEKNCFDYRVVTGIGGEQWVQTVAIEKLLLDSVSTAVWDSGVSLELMIPIGVLIGEKTIGKEIPALVKWNGIESIKVIAVNGLTDSVYTDETDEQINEYAKKKWNLTVDLEQIVLDASFDLTKEAFKEKNKGEDAEVLSIPVLKKQGITVDAPKTMEGVAKTPTVAKKTPLSKTTIILLVVLGISLVVMSGVLYLNAKQSGAKPAPAPVKPVVVVATPSATPTVAAKVDLGVYKVQVLNGSGVTGEAGRIKELLIAKGFVTVDTGNAPARTDTSVRQKQGFASEALVAANDNLKDYKVGDTGLLTSDDKYDLVIVLGSNRNQ